MRRRLWRYLFGERARVVHKPDGIVWVVPRVRPGWRKPRTRALGREWHDVGYTTEGQ